MNLGNKNRRERTKAYKVPTKHTVEDEEIVRVKGKERIVK